MSYTLLEDLLDDISLNNDNDSLQNITPENFSQFLTDFSQPLIQRVRAINFYYEFKKDEVIEVLKRLISIYSISYSVILKEYLTEIALNAKIPYEFRLEVIKDLATYKEDDNIIFNALTDILIGLNNSNITTPKKIECICVLMRNKNFHKQALYYLFQVIDDSYFDNDYSRYKIITSLKVIFDQRKTWATKSEKEVIDNDRKFFERESFLYYLSNKKNSPQTRILSAQALLVNYSEEVNIITKDIFSYLLEISNDKKCDYNVRADATDVVLKYGDEESKNIAKEIIKELGRNGLNTGEVKNIYQNAQNAHTKEIEESAIKSLEFLSQIPLIKVDNNNKIIDFEYVFNNLTTLNNEKINITLNRINLDNALYGKLSISLKNALTLIYSYISTHEYKEVLFDRLKEELIESADICSTGILERIVNTLSGFEENLGIHISFEDQITANFGGRLNKKIQDLLTQPCIHKTYKEKFCTCLQEICENSKDYLNRKMFISHKQCEKCILCVQRDRVRLINIQSRFKDLECIHSCPSDNANTLVCNSQFVDTILAEMLVPTSQPNKRMTFLKFLRLELPSIMEDMKQEFKEYMDIIDFDMYFRKALINYEGEN